MTMQWEFGKSAPKDGTIVLCMFADMSGVYLARFGVTMDGKRRETWFYHDYSDEAPPPDIWTSFNFPPERTIA